ncbi:hypothetical protein SAMN05216483_6517 [Streptomyces sp. 2131.1]|uniref:hypothetical protein n=1 Tax=Streptomyces sp. 2131.1 TaxID=1855346 RepID=UPI0008958547|nr:hypothetical protein [Streptomyces sp. 2131.1]SEE77350.1 hypothetical protein SAMN05216483_6517 [Streptomyces sp. 2131.1]
MCSLLESFFDTMDQLHVDFRRRLEDIEREAWPAPVPSAGTEHGHTAHPDKFEEIRYPLGLRPLWTDEYPSAEPVKAIEEKGPCGPVAPIFDGPPHAETIVRVMKRQAGTIRRA